MGELYLLGYTRQDDVLLVYLRAVGPHENFYRDLNAAHRKTNRSDGCRAPRKLWNSRFGVGNVPLLS
jgi:hypothetical protein